MNQQADVAVARTAPDAHGHLAPALTPHCRVSKAAASAAQSIAQMRAIVADLYTPNPLIYWTDLLVCLTIGYSMGFIYLSSPPLSLVGPAAFVVCSFALFRAGIFVHEIAHMRDAQMRGFQVGWNLLCGIPMMMPSHFYTSHIDHHNTQRFGTPHDGEYLPLANGTLREIGWFFAQVVWMPALIAVRLLFCPLTFVHPRVREFALERISSYVINFNHRLDVRLNAPRRAWAALEMACSLRIMLPLAIVGLGVWPWTRLLMMYVLAMFVLGLNYIRNLVAHRYQNDGQPMTHAGQLADSTTIANRNLVTGLFFPVGLRYHALHHLFPSIPYHNLARAHRRLIAQLPPDAPYHQTIFPGYWAAVRDLLANVRKHPAQRNPTRLAHRLEGLPTPMAEEFGCEPAAIFKRSSTCDGAREGSVIRRGLGAD